jgi:hypothetical protein
MKLKARGILDEDERKIKCLMRGCPWSEGVGLDNSNNGMADTRMHYESETCHRLPNNAHDTTVKLRR